MSAFTGPLTITEIDVDLDIWRIEEPLTYEVGELGSGVFITTPKGFHSNGASIPLPFRWVMPRWGKWRRPAVQHDFWYWHYRITGSWGDIGSRKDADMLFREALHVVNVKIAEPMYLAVRLGGGFNMVTKNTKAMDKCNEPLEKELFSVKANFVHTGNR